MSVSNKGEHCNEASTHVNIIVHSVIPLYFTCASFSTAGHQHHAERRNVTKKTHTHTHQFPTHASTAP
eukprot:m.34785 g.34785  ORF g.34785 m.34785 type:complete len:68 (-) comp14325_c0_seq2:84-287(-)